MTKSLFIPTAFNDVPTIALIWQQFTDAAKPELHCIAVDGRVETLLEKHNLPFRRLAEYRASNAYLIIKQEEPDLVLTNDFSDMSRAFIYAAISLGVPALFINDGVTTKVPAYGNHPLSPRRLTPQRIAKWLKTQNRFSRDHELFFTFRTILAFNSLPKALRKIAGEIDPRFPRSYIKGLRYAVAGNYAKKAYIDMGVPPEAIFITGQPRFDRIFNQIFDHDSFYSSLRIPQNKKLIVLATQPLIGPLWTAEDQRNFIESVITSSAEFPDYQLILKLHPAEGTEYYSEILKTMQMQDKVIICRECDLYELLNACDLLIAAHSTVALEAMLFNKPVITINYSRTADIMPYASSGAALGVYQVANLLPTMKNALFNMRLREELAAKRKQFVIEQAYLPDGQASKRAAELILELSAKHQSAKL